MKYLLIFLTGCASCPGDELRVVNPVSWAELDLPKLQDRCNDWSPNLRGCVVSGPDGDRIYVLPLEKHVGTEL